MQPPSAKSSLEPTVSVIIPVFNSEKYIQQCIKSVINQTLRNFEVFLIDDGSSDRSIEKAQKIIHADPRFKIIRHETNRGLPTARNTGLKAARGQYVYHVDSDDFLAPYALEYLAKRANTDGAEVTMGVGRRYPSGSLIRRRSKNLRGPVPFMKEPTLWSGGAVYLFLFNRSFINNINGFLDDVQYGEDHIYLAKVLPRAQRVSFVSQTCYYYRPFGGISRLGDWSPSKWLEFSQLVHLVSKYLKNINVAWNYNLLSQLKVRIDLLICAEAQLQKAVFNKVLNSFVQAYTGFNYGLVHDPTAQPWRPVICLPKYLCRLLSLLADGNILEVGVELNRLKACYLDPNIVLSRHALREGDLTEALKLAQKAANQNPQHPLAHHHLSLVCTRMKLFGPAENAESRSLQLDSAFADSHFHMSQLLRRRNDNRASIKHAERSVELDPYDCAPHVQLGRCLLDEGDVDGALKCQELALALDPECAQAIALLSRIESRRNRLDEAVSLAARAVEIDPDNFSLHQQQADLLLKQGRQEEALQAARQAVAFDPGNAGVQHHLGNLLQKFEILDEAETAHRRAVKLKPQLAEAHKQLSAIFAKQKRWEEAIQSAKIALECDPENAKLHHHLGNLLQKAKRLSESEICQRRAIEINSKLAGAHKALSNILALQEKREEAVQSARQAIECEPKNPSLYDNLGKLLQKLGRLREAEIAYGRAIGLDPNMASPHKQLSALYAQQNRMAEAVDAAERAIRADPQNAGLHRDLSKLLQVHGRVLG